MKKQIILFALFIITINNINILAQNTRLTDSSRVFSYRGRIVDEESKPIVFVHVINKHRGQATTTDSTGFFIIPVVNKDSLRVSAIGFQTTFIVINTAKDTIFHTIELKKKTYDIATVNIYELRWQVFKAEFMEQKVEEDKTAKRISNWMAHLVPSDELRMIFQGSRGPGFAINYRSKSEKQRTKVAEMEKKYQLIAPKFNDKMVTEITGLQGQDIYKFMEFCNFEENFLMQATEYEIMEKILEYWKEYQKKNGIKKNPH